MKITGFIRCIFWLESSIVSPEYPPFLLTAVIKDNLSVCLATRILLKNIAGVITMLNVTYGTIFVFKKVAQISLLTV